MADESSSQALALKKLVEKLKKYNQLLAVALIAAVVVQSIANFI